MTRVNISLPREMYERMKLEDVNWSHVARIAFGLHLDGGKEIARMVFLEGEVVRLREALKEIHSLSEE